ncbi:hypothetical protein AAG584_16265 [Vreelandella titanicae]
MGTPLARFIGDDVQRQTQPVRNLVPRARHVCLAGHLAPASIALSTILPI